jgi:hypothetical protein
MITLWMHTNEHVDGCHVISLYENRDTAYARMKDFIGHDEYKRGPDALGSDDGDFSCIAPVHFEDSERLDWEVTNFANEAPFVWARINGTAAEAIMFWGVQEREAGNKLRLRLVDPGLPVSEF